jgi:hypothetical protein
LAFNPSTPVAVAVPLLPTLLRQDVLALLDSRALSEALRSAARALLDPRAGAGPEADVTGDVDAHGPDGSDPA